MTVAASSHPPGLLALVGGAEWTDGCSFDAQLWQASGESDVLVLPTAAAYEHPDRMVDRAVRYFSDLGAKAKGLAVLSRVDAHEDAAVRAVRDAGFIYLGGGS